MWQSFQFPLSYLVPSTAALSWYHRHRSPPIKIWQGEDVTAFSYFLRSADTKLVGVKSGTLGHMHAWQRTVCLPWRVCLNTRNDERELSDAWHSWSNRRCVVFSFNHFPRRHPVFQHPAYLSQRTRMFLLIILLITAVLYLVPTQ